MAIDRLEKAVDTESLANKWLDLVETEFSFLIAKTMLEAEKRKHEREAEWAARMEETEQKQINEEGLWNNVD